MAKVLSSKQWGQIFAHAWKDPAFKDRLEKDPKSAIAEIADKLDLRGNEALHSVPSKPAELSDEQVDKIARGDDDIYFHPAYCC